MKPTTPRSFTLYRIDFTVESPVIYTDYTGKLVKSILATASKRLEEVLTEKPRRTPKPVSLSPVLLAEGERLRPLYPRSRGPGEPAGSVTLHPGRLYSFLLGFEASLAEAVQELVYRLLAGLEVETKTGPVVFRMQGFSELARYNPGAGPLYKPRPGGRVEVETLAPVLPTSPLLPGSRMKRLDPSPLHVFSVNIHSLYPGSLQALRAVELLVPEPGYCRTMRREWYIYDGRPLPALRGRLSYRVDDSLRDVDEDTLRDMLETLAHVLSHAAVMGIGSSRATGFGRVRISVEEPGEAQGRGR